MKKLLLSTIFTVSLSLNAQTLLFEDSSFFSIGDIGTDLTGNTPGQGGWLPQIPQPSTGSNSSFQVVDYDLGTVYGNVIKITGFNQNTGSTTLSNTRFLRKSISTQWNSRSIGNDILEVEYDFYTGDATLSRNSFAVYVYSNETSPRIIAGFIISKNISLNLPGTTTPAQYVNCVRGIALNRDAQGSIGYLNVGLGLTTPFQVESTNNAWLKLGFCFNKSNGEVIWRVPSLNINKSMIGAATGYTPATMGLLAISNGFTATPNTVSASGLFDNLVVKAVPTDTLLAVDTIENTSSSFSILPNPANKFINVSNTENSKISEIYITDINSRIVKTEKVSNLSTIEIDISELNAGIYFAKIKSEKGIVTKKFLKN